jgi:hypothetical protein
LYGSIALAPLRSTLPELLDAVNAGRMPRRAGQHRRIARVTAFKGDASCELEVYRAGICDAPDAVDATLWTASQLTPLRVGS